MIFTVAMSDLINLSLMNFGVLAFRSTSLNNINLYSGHMSGEIFPMLLLLL